VSTGQNGEASAFALPLAAGGGTAGCALEVGGASDVQNGPVEASSGAPGAAAASGAGGGVDGSSIEGSRLVAGATGIVGSRLLPVCPDAAPACPTVFGSCMAASAARAAFSISSREGPATGAAVVPGSAGAAAAPTGSTMAAAAAEAGGFASSLLHPASAARNKADAAITKPVFITLPLTSASARPTVSL
jgi:pilus assembly protein FimV